MKKLVTFFLIMCLVAITASVSVLAVKPIYKNENLTPFDVPLNGVVFTFDNTYATANGELTAIPKGTPEFIEDRNGKLDGAIYLDTAEDYLDLLMADYEGSWSVSTWIRTDEAVNWSFLLHSASGSIRTAAEGNMIGEVGVTVSPGYGTAFGNHMFNVGLELGEWQMLTFTHNLEAKIITVYIDGEPIESFENTMALPLAVIGGDNPDLNNRAQDMYMALDDLWIVGRTLIDADVKSLYETGTFEQIGGDADSMSEEEYAAILASEAAEKAAATKAALDAEAAANRALLEARSYITGLDKYAVPARGIHFSFDGTYSTDNGELKGEAQGSIVSVADRHGNADAAVNFDTAEDFVLINKADFWGNWSASAWVKFDGRFPEYSFLTQSGTTYSLRPAFNGGRGEIGIGRYVGDIKSKVRLTIDTWQMVTYAYDDSVKTVTIYLDGVECAVLTDCEMPLALAFIGSDAPVSLGGKGWAIDPRMNVDDLWLFGKTLTAEEVTELYNNNFIAGLTDQEPVEITTEESTEATSEEIATEPSEESAEDITKEPAEQTVNVSLVAIVIICIFSAGIGLAFVLRKIKA